MPQQNIDIGAAPNDGTGDPLRDAFDKCNDNFTELYALIGALSWKKRVRAATTAAVTLATGLENGDTIDGVVLATGDRVLVKEQAAPAENGIYTVNASGAPTRADDANAGDELVNATVYVSEGTTLADTVWTCETDAPINLGVTGLAFGQLGGVAPVAIEVQEEGVTETAAASVINFVGAGVTAADQGGGVVEVTIPGGGASALNDLSDVDTTGAADGEVLTHDGSGWVSEPIPAPTESLVIACSDEATALTAGVGKVTFRMPYAFTLTAVRASLTTAQTGNGAGGIFTVDVNEAGASMLSTKLTIDNGEKTSTTAATPPVISDGAIADDAEMTIDIDQIGDGTAKGLKVVLIGHR